jgi:hypothetical protein
VKMTEESPCKFTGYLMLGTTFLAGLLFSIQLLVPTLRSNNESSGEARTLAFTAGTMACLGMYFLRVCNKAEKAMAFASFERHWGPVQIQLMLLASRGQTEFQVNLKLGLTLRQEARERRIISKCETFH